MAGGSLGSRPPGRRSSEHPRWREAVAPHVEATLNASDRTVRSASGGWRRIPRRQARPATSTLIVATGNIHEDVIQAEAAAGPGARYHRGDPHDRAEPARPRALRRDDRGFGGTYATQENFRLMRARPRRTGGGDRPLHPPRSTTARACACPRSPPWGPSSGWT